MNHELMHQCRREAEEVYPTQAERLRDCGYDEDAVWSACTDQAARRGAYAAALYAERSKGALRYRSECSGLWYTNREAAGDVDAVEVDGVMYVSNKQGEMLDKRRELTDEEIERVASMCCPGETSQIMQASVPNGPIPLSQGENIRRHIVMALRYARDNDYLAPAAGLTVEEAEDCLVEHLAQYGPDWSAPARSRLRARLEAAANK